MPFCVVGALLAQASSPRPVLFGQKRQIGDVSIIESHSLLHFGSEHREFTSGMLTWSAGCRRDHRKPVRDHRQQQQGAEWERNATIPSLLINSTLEPRASLLLVGCEPRVLRTEVSLCVCAQPTRTHWFSRTRSPYRAGKAQSRDVRQTSAPWTVAR